MRSALLLAPLLLTGCPKVELEGPNVVLSDLAEDPRFGLDTSDLKALFAAIDEECDLKKGAHIDIDTEWNLRPGTSNIELRLTDSGEDFVVTQGDDVPVVDYEKASMVLDFSDSEQAACIKATVANYAIAQGANRYSLEAQSWCIPTVAPLVSTLCFDTRDVMNANSIRVGVTRL
jgi:hypothetical protein